MLKEKAIVITIQGKASEKTIGNFLPGFKAAKNAGWFFIDFAINEVSLNTQFDVLLEGESKKLILGPGSLSVKLLGCLDQFGHNLNAIPKGYNTICNLEFSSPLPATITKQLPTLSSWDYNPNAISLARHSDIELATPDGMWKNLFVIISSDIKSKFGIHHINRFSQNEFTNHVKEIYNIPPVNADKILESLLQLGKVTKQNDDLMEFVEQESV